MRVEAVGNLARGPNPSVGFWMIKSNCAHLDLRKVLTTKRVVSTDCVTRQHCPKIASAKQPFTIS
jgi:hypothetical protein